MQNHRVWNGDVSIYWQRAGGATEAGEQRLRHRHGARYVSSSTESRTVSREKEQKRSSAGILRAVNHNAWLAPPIAP